MFKDSRWRQAFFPGLGLVLGAAAGVFASTLDIIQITGGVIGGAAIGLLLGVVVSNLSSK